MARPASVASLPLPVAPSLPFALVGAFVCCSCAASPVRPASEGRAMDEYAAAVRETTGPSLVLIDRCKVGDGPACDIVKANLQALDTSASELSAKGRPAPVTGSVARPMTRPVTR